MATCLIALGSNLGDRATTLKAALADLGALPDTRLLRHSRNYSYPSLGGPVGQPDFLNAVAIVETSLAPLALFELLVQIEMRHGRQRTERWAARTLDIDLLLYGNEVVDKPSLVVPHPRMSFRRFVLEPAAEIAATMIHPTIGWSIQQLLEHLNTENVRLAIVSRSDDLRQALARTLTGRFRGQLDTPALGRQAGNLWPQDTTTWISFARGLGRTALSAAGAFELGPKLTILLDGDLPEPLGDDVSNWGHTCQQPGRGPTLRIGPSAESVVEYDAAAAIEAVWPALGRPAATRVE